MLSAEERSCGIAAVISWLDCLAQMPNRSTKEKIKIKKRMAKIDLIKGDCLKVMKNIPDNSVDMVLCDLPYGTTNCKWDSIIPFGAMWNEIEHIVKPNGVIALFSAQPFTSALISSNYKNFKYDWVWEKDRPSNPLVANKRVMPRHESICIFYQKQPTYNPQKQPRKEENKRNNKKDTIHNTDTKVGAMYMSDGSTDLIHPSSILKFTSGKRGFHPTQKPVELLEYLIKTYTNEEEIVMDFTMGSGSTGVACKNTNRGFLGIEKDDKYFDIAENRINGTEFKPNGFEKTEERGLFLF